LAIGLSALRRSASDYPFDIFTLFLQINIIAFSIKLKTRNYCDIADISYKKGTGQQERTVGNATCLLKNTYTKIKSILII
jgi:hypothetical protein